MEDNFRRDSSESGLAVIFGVMGLCGLSVWILESAGLAVPFGKVGFWRGLGLLAGIVALGLWTALSSNRRADLHISRVVSYWVLAWAIFLILFGTSHLVYTGLDLLIMRSPGLP